MQLIWDINKEANNEIVIGIQEELGIKLPKIYTDILNMYDGSTLRIRQEESLLQAIVVSTDGYSSTLNLIESEQLLKEFHSTRDIAPSMVIPFSMNGGGDYLVFDYRKSKEEPEILVLLCDEICGSDLDIDNQFELDIELSKNLHYVCESFEKLLEIVEPHIV